MSSTPPAVQTFLLLFTALRAANIAAVTPGRHSVSYLLDSANNTLHAPLLSLGSFGYELNATLSSRILRTATGYHFRPSAPPVHWDRYHAAWFTLPFPKLPSLRAARHRVLLSSVRDRMGDGIGHMYFMYNFEVFLATRLRLAFAHRRSSYQSLTKRDPAAVDAFFGWAEGSLPREAIWAECALSYTYTERTHRAQKCTACEAVTGRGPRAFQRVVQVPSFLVYNCTSKHGWSERCDHLAHQLLESNNQSHTIFQMPPGSCDYEGTNTNVSETGPWFYHKYWMMHGRRKSRPWPNDVSEKRKDAVRFEPQDMNLAVHIRRGDFFNESSRRMFSDAVFARTLADAMDIVDSAGGIFSKAVPVVHIYSEGKLLPDRAVSSHDVDGMDNIYYDENQNPRSAREWQDLVKSMQKSDERLQNSMRNRVKVRLHISEDTLANMHEMVSADIFVGSDSSMSLGPVYMLSRGVRLLATHPLRRADRLYAGFDPQTGELTNAEKFYRSWMIYEAANGPSLLHFLQQASE